MSNNTKTGIINKELIVEKAGKLFWQQGYERTSIRDIAKACGCQQANLYNYFKGKEEILFEVLWEEMEQAVSVVRHLEDANNMSPIERLKALIKLSVGINLVYRPTSSMLFDSGLKSLSRSNLEKIIEFRNYYDRILRKIIREGIDQGIFANFDEKIIAFAIDSMILRCRIWFSPKGKLSAEEVGETLANFILKGIELTK